MSIKFNIDEGMKMEKMKMEGIREMGDSERKKLDAFLEIVKEVERDPESRRRMEEKQRLYGSLTEEDLKKLFTI
jgi:rRNA maturation endonuclease Nob1